PGKLSEFESELKKPLVLLCWAAAVVAAVSVVRHERPARARSIAGAVTPAPAPGPGASALTVDPAGARPNVAPQPAVELRAAPVFGGLVVALLMLVPWALLANLTHETLWLYTVLLGAVVGVAMSELGAVGNRQYRVLAASFALLGGILGFIVV